MSASVRCGNRKVHGAGVATHESVAQVRLCFSREGGLPSVEDGAVREEFDPDAAYERHLEDGGRHAAQIAWEAAEEERAADPWEAIHAAEERETEERLERTLEDAGHEAALEQEAEEARRGVIPFSEAYADALERAARDEPLYDGVYTVERPDSSYRTFRLRTQGPDAEFAPGKQVIEYLSGADNDGDYTGFAFVSDGEVKVWRKHRGNVALLRDAEALLADPTAALVAAHCFRCHRTLTVPASIHAGFGPECAKKAGAA